MSQTRHDLNLVIYLKWAMLYFLKIPGAVTMLAKHFDGE